MALSNDEALINRKLPKELLLRIFSFLDTITSCRCAQISKYWNVLALDGSNWQRTDLFNFQKFSTGRVLENISKRCGGFLRQLSLRDCLGVGDSLTYFEVSSILKTFAQNYSNIEYLTLNGCTQIMDSTCYSLSKFCPRLQQLDLTFCVSITNNSLRSLSEGCENLKFLNLSWCDQILKDVVEVLVKGCNGLTALLPRGCTQSLSHCELITDDGILHLSNSTRGHEILQILELDNCLLSQMLENCHNLERIELYNCQQVTCAGIKRIKTHLPNVKVHACFAPVTPPPPAGGSQQLCHCCIIL
ncbi:LOW QUALITY PROTEIN: F-box/LRR-repeat protein 2 [Liasis olivaceus]